LLGPTGYNHGPIFTPLHQGLAAIQAKPAFGFFATMARQTPRDQHRPDVLFENLVAVRLSGCAARQEKASKQSWQSDAVRGE
jgi:hypothetical protein